MNHTHRLALAALLSSLATMATAGTVGDPARPEFLSAALTAAYAAGDRDIVIAPGTYELPPSGNDSITLEHWEDTHVRASGVLIIFDETRREPVRLEHCNNVSFEGATLRFKTAPDTQGRIRQIGKDPQGFWCDWQIDAGYRTDIDAKKMTYNCVDAATRLLKVTFGDIGVSAAEKTSPDTFRLHFRRDVPMLTVNDWLVTRASGEGNICHVGDSTNVTLQSLTLQNGGFGTIFETGGGGNHYLNCDIGLGPKPAGATEEEIVSCGADGFHSTQTTIGPDIEDCNFSGVFLDDCIAIHGTFQKVISSDGSTVTLQAHPSDYAVDEPIRFSSEHGFFAQAICTAVNDLGNGQIQLTVDNPLTIPTGAKANNPDRCGKGYKILRCHLGNTRSRGILVKADDGIIDGCVIEGTGMSAISVGPEYYWNEANYCWNVTLSNNVIRNCVKRNSDDGAIFVHGDGAIGNRNITIKNNLFDSDYGQIMMNLNWVDGVQISGNRIVHCFQLPLKTPGVEVYLSHARHVSLDSNVLEDAGPSYGKAIGMGPDVDLAPDTPVGPPRFKSPIVPW